MSFRSLSLKNKLKMLWLRHKARRLHGIIERNMETADCGLSVLCFIRPGLARVVADFDATVAEAKKVWNS